MTKKIDFINKDFYIANCDTGSLNIKKLTINDADKAYALYKTFEMTRDNYKTYIGLCEYDDFYGFGGRYEKLTASDFARMAESEDYVALCAYQGEQNLCGVIWASRRADTLAGPSPAAVSGARMKPEFAGVPKIMARLQPENGLVFGHASVCVAPKEFPSALATLNYAMTEYLLSLGVRASIGELHKNVSCTDCDGVHFLDTFDYNAYNAYKMLGFDHVGNMPLRDIKIDHDITIKVEPQIIACLDLELQKMILSQILSNTGVDFL